MNRIRRSLLLRSVFRLSLLLCYPHVATAETCFHACFSSKKLPTDVTDQMIRETMQGCQDICLKEEQAHLVSEGFGPVLKNCIPAQISDTDMKKIRSASPSVLGFANAFTWDVNNVLTDKIIRRVELETQTMALQGVLLSASGYLGPGKSATFYIGNIPDGYPSLRVTTRIRAIYACNTH